MLPEEETCIDNLVKFGYVVSEIYVTLFPAQPLEKDAHWRYLANTIELSVHVGDAALC